MSNATPARTMRVFFLIWLGQSISLIGTQLTAFVLGVWVYRETGSVTSYALISFSATLPGILLMPVIGTLVDRWDRRLVLLVSDIAAALVSLVTLLLLITGQLAVWHIYIIAALFAILSTFQWPAFSASITVLVPKQQYVRANGMVQAGVATAQIAAPVLAGVLLDLIRVEGVVAIDFVTFLFSVITLLLVRFPRVAGVGEGKAGQGSFWQASVYGWKYITARPGLFGLLLFLAFVNFCLGMVVVLLTPLILSFTSTTTLGTILSISGLGLLLGSVLVSVWNGPRQRVQWIFIAVLLQALLLFLGGFQPSVALIGTAAFLFMFCTPFINSASQAIWQSKVAPGVQGRVFSIRRMIAVSMTPVAYLIAGPLADRLFEPLMAAEGPLAGSAGRIIGVGTGRGIGLLFIVLGFLTVLVAILFFLSPRVRRVEEELPDASEEQHDPAPPVAGDVRLEDIAFLNES